MGGFIFLTYAICLKLRYKIIFSEKYICYNLFHFSVSHTIRPGKNYFRPNAWPR